MRSRSLYENLYTIYMFLGRRSLGEGGYTAIKPTTLQLQL